MGTHLTLVFPYYNNPAMLSLQYAGWASWADKRRKRLRVILVDDGSQEPAVDVTRPDGLEIAIYRVLEDRPWHQHAARNLGAHVAPEGWMLMTDMDHVLSEESASLLFKAMDKGRLDESRVYMLGRIEADTGLPTLGNDGNLKPHPNSFVLTRDMYWRIGGYDEDYCGTYGTDRLFRDRAQRIGGRSRLDIPLTRYWRDLVEDASTRTLPRKEGRDPLAKQKIAEAKAARGEAGVIKVLQFPWERVF